MVSCAKCKTEAPNLARCSSCRSVFYCSKKCQLDHWKAHKSDCRRFTAPSPSKSLVSNPASSKAINNVVWGVKITHNGNKVPIPHRFIACSFSLTHPIFTLGELCPFTRLYGIPIIIFSPCLHTATQPLPDSNNQPAVYLRIEPKDGFAPFHWQVNDPGDCYVVRQDKSPLSKELVETMYEYHDSLLSSTYFEDILEGIYPPGHNVNPYAFQQFSDDFWKEEERMGRVKMGGP